MSNQLFFVNDNTAEYGAKELNAVLSNFFSEGVLNTQGTTWEDWVGATGDLKVIEFSTPNMSVDVNIGDAVIEHTRAGATFHCIARQTLTAQNLTVPSNSSGSDRIDAVVISVDSTATLDIVGAGAVAIEYIENTGTPTTAMTDSEIDAILTNKDWVRLANITVGDAVTAINQADIEDTRQRVENKTGENGGGVVYMGSLAVDPAIASFDKAGYMWFNSAETSFKFWDGLAIKNFASAVSGADAISTDDVWSGEYNEENLNVDSTIQFGELDATTRRHDISFSFTASRSKMRGFTIWKKADTGTFTGDIIATLQADSGGFPDGVDIESRTIDNFEWTGIADDSPAEFVFDTEVSNLTVGAVYHVKLESTSPSNSNHPNIGIDTVASYTDGTLNAYNVTDGWIAQIADAYFRIINGRENQVPQTTDEGVLPQELLGYKGLLDLQGGVTPYIDGEWLFQSPSLRRYTESNTSSTTNEVQWTGQNWGNYAGEFGRFAFVNSTYLYYNGNASGLFPYVQGTGAGNVATFNLLDSEESLFVLEWPFRMPASLAGGDLFFGIYTSIGTFATSSNVGRVGITMVGDTNEFFATTANGTSKTDTLLQQAVVPTAMGFDNFIRMRIEVDYSLPTSEIRFYFDGVLVATHTTNLPTSGGLYIGASSDEILNVNSSLCVQRPVCGLKRKI